MFRYTAPSPSSVVLMSLTDNIFTGNAFNVACTVNLPPIVDIPVNVNVTWNESGPIASFLITSESSVMMKSLTEYVSTADVVSNVQYERISFQCAASVGSDSTFIKASERKDAKFNVSIFVVGRPSQPIGLNASTGFNFINITWSKRANDYVYEYELHYSYHIRECQDNSVIMNSIKIDNSTKNYSLMNLEEDSEFNISLVASNLAGKSEPATVVATTLTSGRDIYRIHKYYY